MEVRVVVQIERIQLTKFMCFNRGKKVRVFLSGDYEFLCHLFGLSGASGKDTNETKLAFSKFHLHH